MGWAADCEEFDGWAGRPATCLDSLTSDRHDALDLRHAPFDGVGGEVALPTTQPSVLEDPPALEVWPTRKQSSRPLVAFVSSGVPAMLIVGAFAARP